MKIPKNVELVAVIKNRTPQAILEVVEKLKEENPRLTIRVGVNRLRQGKNLKNSPLLKDKDWEWHFLGKLQSRKIKDIVETFDVIQSVENVKQAKEIAKHATRMKKVPYPIFLQVNLSGEEGRQGCGIMETPKLIDELTKIKTLKLVGLMGIASQNKMLAEQEFKMLKAMQGSLQHCSMGMSEDQKEALEAGSTMLRLGRALFEA